MEQSTEHQAITRRNYLVLAAGIALLFLVLPFFQGIERTLYDLRTGLYRIFHPPVQLAANRLVLVDIDEESLRTLGKFPLSYSHYARFVRVARQAGANAVIFAFPFYESANGRQGLAAFAREMDIGPPTYLTYYFQRSLEGRDEIREALPDKALASRMMSAGFMFPELDVDNVMRHKQLLYRVKGRYHPSLEVITASLLLGVSPDRIEVDERTIGFVTHEVPLESDFSYRVIPGGLRGVARESFLSFLSADEHPQVKGRILLVGATAPAAAGMYALPSVLPIPHPYHHTVASTALDMVSSHSLQQAPWVLNLALALLIGLLAGWLLPVLQGRRAALFLAALGGGTLLLNLLAFLAGWYFSLFNLLAAPAVFYGILSLRRQSIYHHHLAKFVPGGVLEFLKRHDEDLEPGVIQTDAVVLFADIKGYSTLSERNSPSEVLEMLQEYVDIMSGIITSNGGIVMDYQGDGMMAVFGIEGAKADTAYRAVKSASIMYDAMTEWRHKRRIECKELFTFGIGISAGDVAFGTLGSRGFRQYVCIGDTVNLAARLQAIAKERRTPIVICERTNALVNGQVETSELPSQKVKGKFQSCTFFEVCMPHQRPRQIDGNVIDYQQMRVFKKMNLYREMSRAAEV